MAFIGSLTVTGSSTALVADEARWRVANDDGTSPGSVSLVLQTGDFGNAHQRNASGSIIFVGKDGGAISKAGSIVSKPYTNQDLIFSSSQSHADIRFAVNDAGNDFNLLTVTSGRASGGLSGYRGPKVFIADTAAGYNRSVNLDGRGGGLLSISTQTDQLALEIVHTGSSSSNALEIKTLVGGTNGNNTLFTVGASETVVNDSSADHDFRVESDGVTHMLFVDAGNNRVAIGNNAPMGALDINNAGAANYSLVLRANDSSGAASQYSGIKIGAGAQFHITGTNGKVYLDAGTATDAELFIVGKTSASEHTDSRIWFSRMAANESVTQYAYMGYDHSEGNFKFGHSATWGAKEQLTMGDSNTIFNDDSQDINFRIESDDKTHAFFMDGTNGKIQIGDDTTEGRANYSDVTITRTDASTAWDSYDSSANEISEMTLFLRNQSNIERTFTAIGFDVGTEFDVDSIGAAIIAERDGTAHADSTKHDTNLIFATSYGTDDQLTEHLRIAHDGQIYMTRMDASPIITFTRHDTYIATNDGQGAIAFGGNESTKGMHTDIISGTLYQSALIAGFAASNHIPGSNSSGYLTFSTTAVGATTVTENMRIEADGTVGITSQLYHMGDTDTYISFTDDQIDFYAGGVQFLTFEEASTDSIVFNEAGADVNFRVESSGQAYSIYAEGGDGKVQFGGDSNVTGGTGRVIISDAALDATADVGDPTNYHLMLHADQSVNGIGAGLGFAVATDNDDVGGAIIFDRTNSESVGELKFYVKQSTTDAANPTLVMRIADDGCVSIGSPLTTLTTYDNGQLQVYKFDDDAEISLLRKNGTIGAYAGIINGDVVGKISFRAVEQTAVSTTAGPFSLAEIRVEADGALGSSSAPGKMKIRTTISGETSPTTAIAIDATQNVGMGLNSPSYRLDLYDSLADYVMRIKNAHTGGSADGLRIDFSETSDMDTNSHFIQVRDGDSDIQYEVRGDNAGGYSIGTSFTAGHDTACLMDESLVPGMIVESTGEVWYKPTDKNFETALPRTQLSTTANSKTVFGVVAGWHISGDEDERDSVYIVNGFVLRPTFSKYAKNAGLNLNEKHINVMAIGEGVVWVTNINGDIGNGDYIVASNIKGLGQLQDDDSLRSCTVAKCTENIPWDDVADTITHEGQTYKRYLAACTFHCG